MVGTGYNKKRFLEGKELCTLFVWSRGSYGLGTRGRAGVWLELPVSVWLCVFTPLKLSNGDDIPGQPKTEDERRRRKWRTFPHVFAQDGISFSMRTSLISKEASKLVDAVSSTRRVTRRTAATSSYFDNSRQTRSKTVASAIHVKHEVGDSNVAIKQESGSEDGCDDSSVLSEANTTDIEDLLKPEPSPPPSSRKRKRASLVAADAVATKAERSSPRSQSRKPRKVIVKEEEDVKVEVPNSLPKKKATKSRKPPPPPGSVAPPPNWEKMYDLIKDMRLRNPTAPVDTMGCAELYWRNSTEQERRFHILVALMLSSQTKDTVTAVAMHRLHTELDREHDDGNNEDGGADASKKPAVRWDTTTHSAGHSTLTISNILRVSATRLIQLIQTVGFHNLKTKYLRSTASILQSHYNSDIPRTAADLMALPGVGPKMAYLCMSSAWGVDDGIGVDVHVHRITNLWGWVRTKTPEETRVLLEAWLPREKWREINWLLVGLGQTVCLPVGRRCWECALAGTGLCRAEIKGGRNGSGPKGRMEAKMEIKVEEM
ncbi:DNA base excision repair N-glycosylase 2 [Coccidioides immitis H538.4]|uniref:Endonuclease III homolog n=1 Tax=Coccidioides immitis H538.4 TaxID=396776 RepID=A0A0J8S7C9_COCIT|nr:DNA base excision repair N-glycosylase 2 [Coccidioides immitis H538.4]